MNMTFVIGFCSGIRFYAQAECFDALVLAMDRKDCTLFTDVDGERGYVNGKYIDFIYVSTPDTRALRREHDDQLSEEDPKDWSIS